MCYFLYGAIQAEDYKKIPYNRVFHFIKGTKADINDCVATCGDTYRVTDRICDCETALGSQKTAKKELLEFADYLTELANIKEINCLFVSKNWWKEENQKELTIHIKDMNPIQFFSELEDNCLYKILLYKKYY